MQQLIEELDVPPRQVLIEAKIYSIDLSHTFSSDVTAALQALGGSTSTTSTSSSGISPVTSTAASLMAGLAGGGVTLTGATLVGKSRALQGIVSLMESETNAKIISAPSIIATDSIPGLHQRRHYGSHRSRLHSSSALGAVTTGVSNVSTGIGLNITARVTPSGIVTMIINQNVSDPQATDPSLTNISSPSFATKSIQHTSDCAERRYHRNRRP